MQEDKQIQEQKGYYISQPYQPYYEDEISLIDLWLILAKRKRLIAKVFVMFLIIAVVLGFIKKDKYEFTTAFEIGQVVYVVDGKESYSLVEPVASVKAKLESSYLPSAQSDFYLKHPDAKEFKVSVEAPKNAQMLIVKSKGTEADAKEQQKLHNSAVLPLLKDLNRKVISSRQRLESELANAKLELMRLQDPVTVRLLESGYDKQINKELDSIERLTSDVFWLPKIKQLESNITQAKITLQDTINKGNALKEQRVRLDELERLLHRQLDGLNEQIKEARRVRTNAIAGVSDESRAMTLLLLDSEMERLVTRQSKLEERIFIDHKNNIVELENQISANKDLQKDQRLTVLEAEAELVKTKADRESQIKLQKPQVEVFKDQKKQALLEHQSKIKEQEEKLATLESSINGITESHVIVPFLKSLEPKGLTSKVLFVIVVFLGFIFAIISAFVAEFLEKAREKMKEEGIS